MTHPPGPDPVKTVEPVEGPRVGDRAPGFALSDQPGFALTDQHGQSVSLAELGRPTLLIFYPYAFSSICSAELKQLQSSLPEFTAAGVTVAAISVDTMFALRTFSDQLGLTFPLLSDFWPHGAVARSYGVFDPERGCAIRGSFLIGDDGVIGWAVRNEIGEARDIAEHLRAAHRRVSANGCSQ